MLLYWGCEAKADAGQPQTLEQGKNPLLQRIEEVQGQDTVQPAAPSTTSTAWRPNREATGGFLLLGMDDELRSLPLKVSLVGDHLVRSNYSPEIRFSLAKTQDFLAPLNLSATPADSTAKLESLEGSGGGAPRALQQKRGNAGLLISRFRLPPSGRGCCIKRPMKRAWSASSYWPPRCFQGPRVTEGGTADIIAIISKNQATNRKGLLSRVHCIPSPAAHNQPAASIMTIATALPWFG